MKEKTKEKITSILFVAFILFCMIAMALMCQNLHSAESKRATLIKKVNELSDWCGQNDEQITQAILLTLSGALIENADTLLIQYTSEFSKRRTILIQEKRKEINKRKM